MATVYLLRHKSREAVKLTLSGKLLVTGEGDRRVEQSFPSAAAAVEHLERVLGLRRREGYVAETTEVAEELVAEAPDPLDGVVKHDAASGRATVTFAGTKVPRGLCASIAARLAEVAPPCVQVICDHASPGKDFAAALARTPLPSIVGFVFDTHFQTLTRQRDNALGDLGVVLGALPAVERVFVSGKLALSASTHARLRELYLLGDPLGRDAIESLGRASFPALETLALALCSDGGPGPDSAAAAALRALAAPRLARVHVDAIDDVTAFLRALAREPLPPSWTSLSLGGTVRDEDDLLAALKDLAGVLCPLAVLGLPLSDNVSASAIAEASALLPGLVDEGELPEVLLPSTYDEW